MISLTVFETGCVPAPAQCRCMSPSYVLLATCQRVEVYHGDGAAPYEVVRHLWRVTAGLESVHPGETEIQGQVRAALRVAEAEGHVSAGLRRLFEGALAAGRAVRRATHISAGARSYAHGAFAEVREALGGVRDTTIGFAGAHTLQARIAARCRAYGCRRMIFTNRTCSRAGCLAQQVHGWCVPFAQLQALMRTCDAIVVAVRAPAPIIVADMVPRDKPLVLLDMSIPRGVAADVHTLPQVTVRTLDDVIRRLQAARAVRRDAERAAAAMIDQAVQAFCSGAALPGVAA